MKTSILKTVLPLFFASAIFLFGCKKSDPEPTRMELLTSSPWIQTNSEFRTSTLANWSVDPSWAGLLACERDNQLILRSDYTLEVNEGPTKCDFTDPQVIFFSNWQFSPDETRIIISGTESVTITILDRNTLQVTSEFTTGGTTEYYRDTYRH